MYVHNDSLCIGTPFLHPRSHYPPAPPPQLVQIITDLAWLLVRVNADHVQGTLA